MTRCDVASLLFTHFAFFFFIFSRTTRRFLFFVTPTVFCGVKGRWDERCFCYLLALIAITRPSSSSGLLTYMLLFSLTSCTGKSWMSNSWILWRHRNRSFKLKSNEFKISSYNEKLGTGDFCSLWLVFFITGLICLLKKTIWHKILFVKTECSFTTEFVISKNTLTSWKNETLYADWIIIVINVICCIPRACHKLHWIIEIKVFWSYI
jgi:hypothetical protein